MCHLDPEKGAPAPRPDKASPELKALLGTNSINDPPVSTRSRVICGECGGDRFGRILGPCPSCSHDPSKAPESPRGVPFSASAPASGPPELVTVRSSSNPRAVIVAAESIIRRHRAELTTLREAIAASSADGTRQALEILDAEVAPPEADELVALAANLDVVNESIASLGKRLTFLETAWGVPGKPEMVRVNDHRKLEGRVENLERVDVLGLHARVGELEKRTDAHRDQFPELRADLAKLEARGRAQVKTT